MRFAEGIDVVNERIHEAYNRLDISYPSSRMLRTYAENAAAWDKMTMSTEFDIDSVRASLKRIMDKQGVKPTTLSQQVGKSKTLVKEILEGNGDIKLSTLARLASALDVEVEALLAKPRVPVAGYIGAGGQISYEDIGEEIDPDLTVMHPPGMSGKLIALMVRGDSMLPKYRDGDIIYIQRTHNGILPEYLGEDCAVRLVSGETFLKQLTRGTQPDRYTLRSLNAEDMVDMEIEWATPVALVMPGRARHFFDIQG